jgi:uncharacterized repeat protein (TIGR01451 family)
MLNHPSLQKAIQKSKRLLSRHWLVTLFAAMTVAILWFGAPAWAAPVARPLGQTVPNPTPTSEGDPVATATPQPDDAAPTPDPSNPNIEFQDPAPGSTPQGSTLTARATIDGLNLREGPDTTFNTLGTVPVNTQITVISRNDDGSWWYICCLPNSETRGWVSAQLLAPDFDVSQANSLIPLFGTAPVAAPPAAATSQAPAQAALPLELEFQLNPYFVWQGITATLTITVNNPNNVDALNVLVSDELPVTLTLMEAIADANGVVETVNTASGRPLLLFRWETIPADTSVTASIVMLISPLLTDGEVIDNLVAARARNVPYSTSAVTIGMPPVRPPDFQ